MKTFKKMAFGFSAITSGQRAITHEPELIINANPGSFRLTPPVSKALFIAHADYLMFVTNVDEIDKAIMEKNEVIVDFCTANNLDIESQEALIAIHAEFDAWGIAKSIVEKDSKGNVRMSRERMAVKDKVKYVETNFEEVLEAAKASDNEELVAALSREDATEEELKDLLVESIQGDEVPRYKGSKVANPSLTTGYGVGLTFSDSNVWSQLKRELGEKANKVNKVFSLDIDNLIDAEIFDGYENVLVKVAVLGESRIEEPARVGRRGAKEESNSAE